MISAIECVTWWEARGSWMQAAMRSATRRRPSISRKVKIPPSDDRRPPSNLAITFLPETDDRPGNGNIGSFMAGVAFTESRVVLIRHQNHTRNQRFKLHPPAPAELFGLAIEIACRATAHGR